MIFVLNYCRLVVDVQMSLTVLICRRKILFRFKKNGTGTLFIVDLYTYIYRDEHPNPKL